MKSKNIVFRVDVGTHRQIEAEAQRRGLSVSAYARLMCTLPFTEAGPPDERPLNQEIKDLIAEAHDVHEADALTQLTHFKRSVEAVIASQSVIDDTARWLVNISQAFDWTTMQSTSFRQAVEAVIAVQGKLDEAARGLVNIGNTLDLTTRQKRSEPDVNAGHEGNPDSPPSR